MRPEIQAPEDVPPPAPPAPVLSAGASTSTSATVRWTAPETELVISGYELRWRRAGDTNWNLIDEITSAPTEYTIPDLEAGTAYEIQVRARYAGESAWSHVITVETTAAPPPSAPAPAPRRPPRTPLIFKVATVTPTSITVEWTATDTAITHYDLRWKCYLCKGWPSPVRVSATVRTYTIDLAGGCKCVVSSRTVTGEVVGEWFYLAARTRGGYWAPSGPRISIGTDDAFYDEGDGAIELFLAPQDRVSEALTVSVSVSEEGDMLRRIGMYEVRVGVGSTKVGFRVGLLADNIDEPDSYVLARIEHSLDYDVGNVFTAIVLVRDDD